MRLITLKPAKIWLFYVILMTIIPHKVFATKMTETSWEIWRETDQIIIQKRPFQATQLIQLNACLKTTGKRDQALEFLTKPKHIKTWLDNVNSVEVVKQLSANTNIMSTKLNSVWPVKPRHAYVHSVITQHTNGDYEIVQSDAGEPYQAADNHIRVLFIQGNWLISTLNGDQIQLCYTVVADPKGNIPKWIANRVAVRSMWRTLTTFEQYYQKHLLKTLNKNTNE